MALGTKTKGVDGKIKIGATTEIPCLKSWQFSSKSSVETVDANYMLSNADGGSAAGGGWSEKIAGAKEASFDVAFAWQKDDAAGAAGQLRTTSVGALVAFELYPNGADSTLKRVIKGNAIVTDVGTQAEVKGLVEQTVKFEVTGVWTDLAVV